MSDGLGRRLRRLEFARRAPGRPVREVLWFDGAEVVSRLILTTLYRLRVTGSEHVPRTGPYIAVSNHQSLYDPMINGCAVADRPFRALARETLFRAAGFAWLIRKLGAIPLKGEGGDTAAIRAALAELEAGRTVLIYPEGSRSPDGTTRPFERGVALLVRRAGVPILPMGIEGAFHIWPRGRRLPSLRGRLQIEVGPLIPAESLPKDVDRMLDLLRDRVEALRLRRAAAMIRAGWRPCAAHAVALPP